jgi:hypothetical protein
MTPHAPPARKPRSAVGPALGRRRFLGVRTPGRPSRPSIAAGPADDARIGVIPGSPPVARRGLRAATVAGSGDAAWSGGVLRSDRARRRRPSAYADFLLPAAR